MKLPEFADKLRDLMPDLLVEIDGERDILVTLGVRGVKIQPRYTLSQMTDDSVINIANSIINIFSKVR